MNLLELKSFIINSKTKSHKIRFEFHIAADLRKKYQLEDELFSIAGNVIFANFAAVRSFVQKINSQRSVDKTLRIGQVNAMGLLDEIYHFLIREYELNENPGVMQRAYDSLAKELGEEKINKLLFEFIELFPPTEVYKGKLSTFDYLNSYTEDRPNTVITLEELLLLYFANFNPANKNAKEFFNEEYFVNKEIYTSAVDLLDKFFEKEKPFGPDEQDIFTFLKTPILNNPEDIESQLDFIRVKWKVLITDKFSNRILTGKDLIREDTRFDTFGGGGGTPTIAPSYKGKMGDAEMLAIGKSGYKYAVDSYLDYEEPEQFTPDIDWMPQVVIVAKNTYVWLDQLSKKYGRHIHRLDQVPDEELDQLRRWNFTGLWLIGIWERSTASKRIKHIMGNIDAVASAYSLFDYAIAADLGGEEAYADLNRRASAKGLRLASDMVPNHTGIFSDWVLNRPDYFIQSTHPPFPNYTFNGENLSQDPNIELRIEDGYYRHSDAAVVFQRIDKRSGEIRYIYHGNDGTNMPWNDTAQLDMLKKEVREAVIQKIFDVARKFSIIRFDAAMTLTKRHFSRLWYPQPGKGGDIPSRADHAMTREQFDSLFPEEFWREVVDRINREMPDTLLLAEAFWLMEGYFVRSLGMHRVYNSAFMNMLMNEENEKYRDLITNTLEFEPEILKRYVNFMSNPDEETAIKQFGTGDKFFGVSVLMVTLPGLPMFAHGQIEGFSEKYGMEYKRAYYNESPMGWLIERHQKEIFPLMKKRNLFSQIQDFWFYDFKDGYGNINENVFAYSNSNQFDKAIVFYNNKYDVAEGKIYNSTPKLTGKEGDSNKITTTISFAEALGIKNSPTYFYTYKENISGLEFIRPGDDFIRNGFGLYLNGFEYKIFFGFKEVYDETGDYKRLADNLGGRGVPSLDRALAELNLLPIHEAFENLFEDKIVNIFINRFVLTETEKEDKEDLKFISNRYNYFLNEVKKHYSLSDKTEKLNEELLDELVKVENLNKLISAIKEKSRISDIGLDHSFQLTARDNYHDNSLFYLMWLVVTKTKILFKDTKDPGTFIDKLLLATPVRKVLKHMGKGDADINSEIAFLNILLEFQTELLCVSGLIDEFENLEEKNELDLLEFLIEKKSKTINDFLNDEYVKAYLGVNYYEGVWYFSKENFVYLIDWLFTLTLLDYLNEEKLDANKAKSGEGEIIELIRITYKLVKRLKELSKNSGYRLDSLKSNFKGNSKELQ